MVIETYSENHHKYCGEFRLVVEITTEITTKGEIHHKSFSQCVLGSSSSAVAALFLAVACDKSTEMGTGKSDRTHFA